MPTARFRNPSVALLLAMLLVRLPLGLAQQPPQPPEPKIVLPQGFPTGNPLYMPQSQPAQASPQPGSPAQAAKPASPLAEATQSAPAATVGGMNLNNVSLSEVIDFLARQLKINYIIDPRVKGSVTLNTYGEVKDIDPRALLDTILRINGFAMVASGTFYRIVPLADVAKLPLGLEVDQKNIPEDDRAMLNLIFLKYANADELSKLISEFLGQEGRVWSYPPANLLLVLDSRRNMRRTMDLVNLFDSDTLAQQRVKIFDIRNGRPSDISREIEGLLKSISMGKDLQSIKFVPVDRINVLIAVAPNPGVFKEVEKWLEKLDVKVTSAAGTTDTYVYRVKYGRAEVIAGSIMMLYYSLDPRYSAMMGMMGGMGGMGMGGYGAGVGSAFGFALPQSGGMGGGMGMMGGMGGGMGMMGGGMGMMGGFGGNGAAQLASVAGAANPYQPPVGNSNSPPGAGAGGAGAGSYGGGYGSGDMTGQYMGGMGFGMPMIRGPRVVPNMLDNSLLILATREEYESILRILRELDLPPRQVLIEAKIYEVSLSGAFSGGVTAYLREKGTTTGSVPGDFNRLAQAAISNTGGILTAGMLIGQSRELLGFLQLQENRQRTKIIAAPSVVATDSIPALINVGIEVPTLSAQAPTSINQGGSSVFAQSIVNRKTGVTLFITARVNPSGVVTLQVNQEISAPQAPSANGIQSPSFSQRSVSTQVTVQDGDMVAIGGIINEQKGSSSSGLPFLSRIPIAGIAFGGQASNFNRTELVIFLTPRVIYDTNEMADVTEELKSKMKRLQKVVRE